MLCPQRGFWPILVCSGLFVPLACGAGSSAPAPGGSDGSAGAAPGAAGGSLDDAGSLDSGAGLAGALPVPDGGTGTPDAASEAGSSSAGDGGSSGADASAPPPPAPKPPFDWVGVIGTGQSLSVGVTAGFISTTQPFHNLKLVDSGPNPKYPIAAGLGAPVWATAPLTEPIRVPVPGSGAGYTDAQYPNNIFGETPHSGMANTLSALWSARGGQGEYVTAHSVVGWSGHCLTDLDKAGGKRAYPASLNEASVWKGLAAKAHKSFGYGGIILTHGECDKSNPAYGSGLYQLWHDYDADLKAITGQTRDIVLLVSQQSVETTGATGSAVQVWQAGVAHPGQVICTGPKYQYQYHGGLHLPAPGYERLGQKYAEVFDLVVNQRAAWQPLQPLRVARSHAVITIAFHVPNPPLVWDAHLTPPHQSKNTAWANGKGFEVKSSSGAALTIHDTKIVDSTVVITLAADPGPGKVNVGYALTEDGAGDLGGSADGLHGLLRDSDPFVGSDAETLECAVTQGSAIVKSTAPSGLMHRAGRDLVTGANVPAGTLVLSQDSDDQLTLSAPWPKASGNVSLSFRHEEWNFCVHFSLDES